ncbi:aldehyde dehydrogenase [Novacetimonas sp. GS1]|uniref:aldehyde dehydrogenase n=1 Tax=Novacetimonas sp. GS1 TaxID=3119990 RepID=UPI002FCCD2D1
MTLQDPFPETDMPDGRIYVGGEFRVGTGEEITSYFPADMRINRVMRGAGTADAALALERAQAAAMAPAWRNLLPHQRASYLYEIAEALARNADRIAWIQTRDTGKTLMETRALAQSAAATFRYYAAVVETREEAITPARGPYMTLSCYEPVGVVCAITPWNSPIASDAQKVAPALAAGNAVVLKTATWTPLVALEFARIIDATSLPKGLFSVLPGSGEIVGEYLVNHPMVRRISFTGGTRVGHAIALHAAKRMIPVSLELGGKSPTIVFADADQDVAIAGILYGIFSSSGQSCVAGSRLFIHEDIYESFLERLVRAAKGLKVGHPFVPQTQVGPLVHAAHLRTVEGWVEKARKAGGDILAGGRRPEGSMYDAGIYYQPTVIAGLPNTSEACREEIFGPVLTVQKFSNIGEVIALANDNPYALACGIWTRDNVQAMQVGRRITTGTVWINTYKQFSISTPFGGEKESGMGREKGLQGLLSYMRQKSYYIGMSEIPHPWAAS